MTIEDAIYLAEQMPKAELHVHLEGTLEPDHMMSLARKNGVQLPFSSAEEARAARDFTDLQSFLDVYYAGCAALVTRDDFCELTTAYLSKAAADNVLHVEPFFDPQTHTARDVPFDDVIGGILDGLAEGQREFGITSGLIMCFLRDLPAESAEQTLAAAQPWLSQVASVGLDSAEVGNPPEKFSAVFARARALGLRAVAHAGEEGAAELVTRTLDVLHAERIDHGVRAIDDPGVVARLVAEQITLTVCPLSNVRLRVAPSVSASPLKRLLESGVRVTVNSDDPAYFGGYINENFRVAIRELNLTRADVLRLGRYAIEGSFADGARKAELLGELERLAVSPS